MYSHYGKHKQANPTSTTRKSTKENMPSHTPNENATRTIDHAIHRGTATNNSSPLGAETQIYSPQMQKEEGLKLFLERKYSEKKIVVSPKAKLLTNQSVQTTDNIVQKLEEATQQLNYIKALCAEKDEYYDQQLQALK